MQLQESRQFGVLPYQSYPPFRLIQRGEAYHAQRTAGAEDGHLLQVEVANQELLEIEQRNFILHLIQQVLVCFFEHQ